ncbi:hypothetical protein D3C85_1457040 [compost metagenome]
MNDACIRIAVRHRTNNVQYTIHLIVFIFCGFARLYIGDVKNCFYVCIQHLIYGAGVFTLIEMITDAQRFQVSVAV